MAKKASGAGELKKLNSQLKQLQADLVTANQLEGIDEFIKIKVKKDFARFTRVKKIGEEDQGIGKFVLQIDITTKVAAVYVPLSVSSSKKPTGFTYLIEGTAEGMIASADVTVRGEGVTQVTVGSLLYAKIPAGKTASFRLEVTIRGKIGKTYKIIINRLNYKLALADARYKQYLKEIVSDSVKFS